MGSEGEDTTVDKKNQRKKRTSTTQYMMYLDMMEDDPIFAGGKHPRDLDPMYMPSKWKELAVKLNTCSTGPKLTAEEWKKRLNDWKNTTRCKYRRHLNGENVTITSLETRALDLFGKMPPASTSMLQLKEEKNGSFVDDNEVEHQRSSDTLQKQLQAAVDEAIRDGDDDEDDNDDEMHDDSDEAHILQPIQPKVETGTISRGNVSSGTQNTNTTYRTIVVENAAQYPEDDDHVEEFITQCRPTTVVASSAPGTTVTKLINGDIPLKRLRSQASDQIIYEVKKAPATQRVVTVHQSGTTQYQTVHQSQPHQQQHRTIELGSTYSLHPSSTVPSSSSQQQQQQQPIITSQDARDISRQLKRLADIKAEKLKFDIARFKFNNPGFHFNVHL